MFQGQSSPGVQAKNRPGGARKLSWKTVAWLSALPSLFAFAISLFVHAGAIGTIVALSDPTKLDEAEPMAIVVELVSDTAIEDSTSEEAQKVQAEPLAAEEATGGQEDISEPDETGDVEDTATAEELPDTVPVPIMRPKQRERQQANRAHDKIPLAKTKGKAIDQNYDIAQAEQLPQMSESASTAALNVRESGARASSAEKRWLAQLSAHLERRKRYPSQAQSRRQEGVVRVSFVVAPDGVRRRMI